MIEAVILVVFPFAMIYSAISDALTMTIANRVSLVLIAAFLFVAPFIGLGLHEFWLHVAAFALVLAVTFGLFAIGAMGGGDAKLLASTSLWMGLNPALMDYLLASSIFGGLLTLGLMSLRGSNLAIVASTYPALRHLVNERGVPYGIALAAGGLFAFHESPAMLWVLQRAASG